MSIKKEGVSGNQADVFAKSQNGKLCSILEDINDGVVYLNKNRNVIFINRAAETMIGWKKK